MRRATALGLIAGGVGVLAGCTDQVCMPVPLALGVASKPTAFGISIYPQDSIERAISLAIGCGARVIRIGFTGDLDYSDAIFAAAASSGLRVILITPYVDQPVNIASYAAMCVSIQQRYARYNPIWEIWNEPNLPYYWGGSPDVHAYTALAIATAKALRGAGAIDVWSGGTSGIDLAWTRQMVALGAFKVMTGCAVHTYHDPCVNLDAYWLLVPMLPPGIAIHTTETCVPSTQDQSGFLRQQWYVHRGIGIPTMVWCELRDGTAGSSGAYAFPYGLVYANYTPKPAYYVARSLTS
ncbi:MAG: hypothetical protein WBD74_02910 [Candidatus Aquilonibacter sp.]